MAKKILRSSYITFKKDPFYFTEKEAFHYEEDGLIFIEKGMITECGPYDSLKHLLTSNDKVDVYKNCLISAGFIDTHTHYPQTQIIGAYGKQLIDWLNNYTFIAEDQFKDKTHAQKIAQFFLKECLKSGTTSAAVYGTVHAHSVDAFFEESSKLNMRMIAGKVLMDRNAPAFLLDDDTKGIEDSQELINKWHGKKRNLYAITPRFAPTSTPEQLKMTGELWKKNPTTYMQTHISENLGEIEWVKALYPERKGYLDVYHHYGLTGKKALFGHAIHLTDDEWKLMSQTDSSVTHCPTSNEFLGSGLFPFLKAKNSKQPVRVGMATDIGAGTSFSMLQTMNESYKIAQLQGVALSSYCAFYLATKGAAESLHLDHQIGSIEKGMEADLVVLNLDSTELMKFRQSYAKTIEERLFILMTLGDDRCTHSVYVAGEKVYEKIL